MSQAKLTVKDIGRIAGRIADKAYSEVDFSVKVTRADYKRRWLKTQSSMKAKTTN